MQNILLLYILYGVVLFYSTVIFVAENVICCWCHTD